MNENRELSDPVALLIKTDYGNGSGFFIEESLIVTNIHVVARATSVSVELVGANAAYTVEGVAAFDAKNDLVILKIAGEGAFIPTGDSELVQSEDIVQVIGYPNGRYKVTKGPVHSIRNSDKWIRMKFKTLSGNSGGPVLNRNSKVVGVVVGDHDCYSFAIPVNAVKKLLARIQETEPLAQWQKRRQIRAYACLVQSQMKHSAAQQKHSTTLYAEAIVNLDKAIQLNPDYVHFYYNRGVLKFQLGGLKNDEGDLTEAQQHYRDAIIDHTKAIQLCPDYAAAYDNRGSAKAELGQSKIDMGDSSEVQHLYQDSIDDHTEAIKLCPDYAAAYSNRGVGKSDLGQFKIERGDLIKAQHLYRDAIIDHTEAIRLCPDFASGYNNRADVKRHFGKSEEAVENVEVAQNLYKEAIIDINIAIGLDPNNATFYHTQGQIKYAHGDFRAALENYEKAREVDSNYTDVCKDLELAKKALEQQERAKIK